MKKDLIKKILAAQPWPEHFQKSLEERMKKVEVSECQDCNNVYERIPQTGGEDSLNVCPSCRTVEGNWKTYENCDCNPDAAEDPCIPERIDGGKKGCKKCNERGWVEV